VDPIFLTLATSAIAIALSPVPLMELILVLFSTRRVINTIAFVVTLLACTALLLLIGARGGQAIGASDDSGPSTASGVLFAVLGLLLVVIGIRNWRNRADHSEPAILAGIARMGPAPVAFLAFGTVFVNPKNTVLIAASGQTLGTAGRPWLAGALFAVLSTAPYLAAAAYSLLGGAAAERNLDRMRSWLVERNRLIMGILCTVLGLVLLGKGVTAFL
jgi:Sap, sulfolipid-1-addressing protein